MLSALKLRHFRCFDTLEVPLAPSTNVIVGGNAQGKTSILEAACVLLRLQSPRLTLLARAVQHGRRGFALDGIFRQRHLQFYYGPERKKLALDSVVQTSAAEYLQVARVVWFSNLDIEMVRGTGEQRRRFLDFIGMQLEPKYRGQLRAYERALRSRNRLLKMPAVRWREIEAFDAPLIESGTYLTACRARLVAALAPAANEAQHAISATSESLSLNYRNGSGDDFHAALASSRDEDARLRQTNAGPHRDDIALALNGIGSEFASEGQQRSIALASKLAQARLLAEQAGQPPVLLLDDIFGELDQARRNALLAHLPEASQKIIATTNLDWMERGGEAVVLKLADGRIAG